MISLEIDPRLRTLAGAIGLLGADGHINASWFQEPLTALRTMVADPQQRASLFSLLDAVLPPAEEHAGTATERRHPLLDPSWRGNVYVTVDGNRLGMAAALSTPPGTVPQASATLSLPLVNAGDSGVEAIAGSATAPLEMALEAAWGEDASSQRIRVVVSVDLHGHATVRILLDNSDLGAGVLPRVELDAAHLDTGAVTVITGLLQQVLLALTGAGAEAQRVADHLPELLGLTAGRTPLPITSLGAGGDTFRAWLRDLAADADALERTFGALIGLLGGASTAAATKPLHGTILDLGAGATLALTLDVASDASGAPAGLDLGVTLEVAAASAVLRGQATIVSIPLTGTAAVTVLPEAAVMLHAPGTSGALLPPGPVAIGSVAGGLRWDGIQVTPLLELRDLDLNGTPYPRLDLTHASAVDSAANTAVTGELR